MFRSPLLIFSFVCLTLGAPLAGCGDDPDPARLPVRTVMVVDDGIDPGLPVFAGKVAAAFTVECEAPPPGGPDGGPTPGNGDAGSEAGGGDAGPDAGHGSGGDGGGDAGADGGGDGGDGAGADGGGPLPSYEEAKQALLAELGRPDDTCRLRPGIAAKANPFADMEYERARWNGMLNDDRVASELYDSITLDALLEELVKRLAVTRYHGTATAGIIAHANPAVRLVLVERVMATEADVEESFTCLDQAVVDQGVTLFSDPEVRAAYRQRPVARLDRELAEVAGLHQVDLRNESFGRLSRLALEKLLSQKRCPPVALRPYFALLGELEAEDAAQAVARAAWPRLVVKSAGNDGALIDGPQDNVECRPGDPGQLLVGSYGRDRARADFTNFGDCVDLYAPGESVVGPLPGGWLFPHSGTSFSAPLVTRLLTSLAPTPFAADSARSALLSLRAPNRYVPLTSFPDALIYEPIRRGQALQVEGPASAGPAPDLLTHPPSPPVLHRTLWPLRWIERTHRRAAPGP